MKKLFHGGSKHGETLTDTGTDSDLIKVRGTLGRTEVYEKTKYFAERYEGEHPNIDFIQDKQPELTRYRVYIFKHEEDRLA